MSRNKDRGLHVNGDRIPGVAARSPQIGSKDNTGKSGAELRDERVLSPVIDRLQGPLNREVLRNRVTGDIGIAMIVERNGIDAVRQSTAEVGGAEHRAGARKTGYETVRFAAENYLRRPCGNREVGRTCGARHQHISQQIDSQ